MPSRAELAAITEQGETHFRLIEPKEVSDHETVVSVSEAAYRAGYSNAANFTTAFKRRFGVSWKHVRS